MNNPKVMDAVGFIGKYVADNWEAMVDPEDISDELLNLGFSSREISDAFQWIERNTLGVSDQGPEQNDRVISFELNQPNRILTLAEQSKITSDAYGILTAYYNRGLLDPVLLEEIIERAMRSESDEIDEREIRRMTALTLFNRVQAEWREFLHTTNTLVH